MPKYSCRTFLSVFLKHISLRSLSYWFACDLTSAHLAENKRVMIPTSMVKDKRETKGNESDYRLGSLDLVSFFVGDMTFIYKNVSLTH